MSTFFRTISTVFGASAISTVFACGGAGCSHGDNGELHEHPHSTPEATASHILVENKELAEEIKQKILNAEMTFAEAAAEHSTCPSKEQGGSLGQFEQGQMIPEFEAIIFDKEYAIEQVHGPVETQFGQHLIWIESRLNADGTMDGFIPQLRKATARHVLVEEEEKCNELKKQIEESENPEMEFTVVAEAESKCPSGKQNGGSLGEFKQGQMVPEFEAVIFSEEYELSKVHGPVKTQFGFHLIWIENRTGEEGKVSEEGKEEEISTEASDLSTEAPSDEEPSLDLESDSEVVEEKTEEVCEEPVVEEENKHAEL